MIATTRRCPCCGRLLTDVRRHAATCSARCRLRLWRGRLSESVSRDIVMGMSTDRPSLSRVAVAEILGVAPIAVRRLECDPTAGFPRGTPVGHVLALRWRASAIREWAAAHRGEVALGAQAGGRP